MANMRPIRHSLTGEGAVLGGTVGSVSGALVGLISLGVLGFACPPRRSFWPPRALFGPLFLGMSLAIIGVMSGYFALCTLFAASQGSFSKAVSAGIPGILFAAPAAMVCGQIVGAVLSFRQQKAAR